MTTPSLVTYSTSDGGTIEADVYGNGAHGVVLGHGKVFDKESWSDLAERLSQAGLCVVVPNFRGYGGSQAPETDGGYAIDIAASVAFLRSQGAERVSLLGGSMGAVAVAAAVSNGHVKDIDTLILLSPRAEGVPEKLVAKFALFVVSAEEDCADTVRSMHDAAPGEKMIEVYDGDAHAQFLFKSPHAQELTELIERTLTR